MVRLTMDSPSNLALRPSDLAFVLSPPDPESKPAWGRGDTHMAYQGPGLCSAGPATQGRTGPRPTWQDAPLKL